ncbi:MAG TPA: hypothetical protein VMO47_18635 [Rhodothermales bacterium]|nr:hypothetical protein [Rhodothermales bacterium]
MSFTLYVLGFLVVIAGVGWGLVEAGLPTKWVIIVSVILLGIGILSGVSRTRRRDAPEDSSP